MAQTFFGHVSKKLTFAANDVITLVFNNPDDTNALKTKAVDAGPDLDVNQFFTGAFINNVSDFPCYFTFVKGITPSASAVDGVQVAVSKDAANFQTDGIEMIRLTLTGAGDVYLTLT